MQFDLDDADFRSTVARWLSELDDYIIVDLNMVFEQSPGVYPTTLFALWREELARRQLAPLRSPAPPPSVEYDDDLPVGHPVDSDWRFTPESAIDLIELALEETAPGVAVAHIGTPSTFLRCVVVVNQHRHILVDRNMAVIEALVARGVDSPHMMLGVDVEEIGTLHVGAGAAIVDPPWYVNDTLLFLSAAATMCRPDATVVLCQPAGATRPGIDQDRAEILGRVSELGLDFRTLRSGAVRYVTPHFEAVSLRAAMNGATIPVSWRRGDVLLFKRTDVAQPRLLPSPRGGSWQERTFGPVRIKIAKEPTGPELGGLITGDVLTTVSRRDPVRSLIGLWTSGNRVFTVADPVGLGQLIGLCETDLMNEQFANERTVVHAESLGLPRNVGFRLHEILSAELSEHHQRGGIGDD